LNEVIFNLANDIPLPAERKDHNLTGKLAGFRECHIQPDWLLIYSKEEEGELHILNLVRTGTHSDLFKK
ncbi:MAG: type II toxin-antitoxin system YafQ family toxin, partial [Bacteroidales bacterium]|nr:type II toxin-antitoxin system YafQ family toxin [Bacteroidales bacterium]